MRVLVGCECSQVVTAAFRAAGHEAFSCDIQPCYGDFPQYHFQNDLREIFPYIKPELFIAHPPCTYLSRAGLCRLVDSSGQIHGISIHIVLVLKLFIKHVETVQNMLKYR